MKRQEPVLYLLICLVLASCATDSVQEPQLDFARATIQGRKVEYLPYKNGGGPLSGIYYVPSKVFYVDNRKEFRFELHQMDGADYIEITIHGSTTGRYQLGAVRDSLSDYALYRSAESGTDLASFRTDSAATGIFEIEKIEAGTIGNAARISGSFSFSARSGDSTLTITNGRVAGLEME